MDFSDGNGKPHLGPHILAGVNGSGKSTALRTIAWVLDRGQLGFKYDEWLEALKGYGFSRALLRIDSAAPTGSVVAVSKFGISPPPQPDLDHLRRWAQERTPCTWDSPMGHAAHHSPEAGSLWQITPWEPAPVRGAVAAYSPSKSLRHTPNPDLTKRLESYYEGCLGFESTVSNESIQSWLLGLYSKRAIARDRKQPSSDYTLSLERFERALQLLYREEVAFDVEIEPTLQPRLKVRGQSLNFSQLPDGMRSTVGWISDFMMRQDMTEKTAEPNGKRPGILLLDEVDAHLHPLWQRRLLPAMREALPDVQIICTSHSPFVISSCPGARVHVLEKDEHGRAHARPPVDSPIGESVTTTLKEIFGVSSRFDIKTEGELNEWNDLKRAEAAGSLSRSQKDRLTELTHTLAARSEELKSIVASNAAAELLELKPRNGRAKREKVLK
jgi:hypothetical protein